MDRDALLAGLRQRQPAALARAISVVENGRDGFEPLLSALHPALGRAHRIGITGPPGAGKSTLTERLVAALRAQGHTVAVVAVDPTSPFSGGALLGDRIRMESIALDPGVFIRSMATRGSLGGLATSTREVCDVLDAAGFDRILVETVGVGQSELAVSRMADTSLLLLVPESGDGIQTLKSGDHGNRRPVRRQQGRPARRRQVASGNRDHAWDPAGQRLPARAGPPRVQGTQRATWPINPAASWT